MKTSKSHPLGIDWVYIDDKTGKIGLTFCPGKKQKYAMTGSWNRDLEMDLDVIKNNGCAALVTLMEEQELKYVKAPKERMEIVTRSHGVDWFFLPIKDAGVPDKAFESSWQVVSKQLFKLLNGKQSIVVHCLGGLGRTGMIAARILVEFGINPEEAISRVRDARQGAIETKAQEEYVRQQGWLYD